jgi:hypothetical protein
MKILPIYSIGNSNYHTPIHKNTSNSFKGLWGIESNILDIDDNCVGTETTQKFYYPFVDETSQEIERVSKECTRLYTDTMGGQVSIPVTEECSVMSTLPFSEAEWKVYQHNKFSLSKTARNYIEESLKRFNLRHLMK